MKLFAYGSMMARSEVTRAIGELYDGPMEPYTLEGYRRDWTGSEKGFAYLNLTPDPASRVLGTLLDLTAPQVAKLDQWESTYDRVPIGGVHAYVCKPEFRAGGSAVLRSYWTLAQSALSEPLPELPCHIAMADQA